MSDYAKNAEIKFYETKAKLIAWSAHRAVGHKRKYSLDCYTRHLDEVAFLVKKNGCNAHMVAAAWLHDVVEDTGLTNHDVRVNFDCRVSDLVGELTDISKPEDGNRKVRKAIDREHLSKASPDAQTIKYCDIISNTSSIRQHDPNFAKVYLAEIRLLLAVMDKGNPILYKAACDMVKA